MAVESFPDLAVNLLYTVLCLAPGFVTLKTVNRVTDVDVDVDSIADLDKAFWTTIASGLSISLLYFTYVAWVGVSTGRMALVVPLDLKWTQLVAAYPLLLLIAVTVGLLGGGLVNRARPARQGLASESEQPTD